MDTIQAIIELIVAKTPNDEIDSLLKNIIEAIQSIILSKKYRYLDQFKSSNFNVGNNNNNRDKELEWGDVQWIFELVKQIAEEIEKYEKNYFKIVDI